MKPGIIQAPVVASARRAAADHEESPHGPSVCSDTPTPAAPGSRTPVVTKPWPFLLAPLPALPLGTALGTSLVPCPVPLRASLAHCWPFPEPQTTAAQDGPEGREGGQWPLVADVPAAGRPGAKLTWTTVDGRPSPSDTQPCSVPLPLGLCLLQPLKSYRSPFLRTPDPRQNQEAWLDQGPVLTDSVRKPCL